MSEQLPGLPPRPRDAHKGTFGTLAVVGGSDDGSVRMLGAPALCARAALRTGAGLVRLVMPSDLLTAGLQLCPESTGIALPSGPAGIEPHEAAAALDRALGLSTVLAIGPGLGTAPWAQALTLRALGQDALPVVADADALNCLSKTPSFTLDLRAAAVLTPHPGEFRRLCAALGLKNDLGLDRSRESACTQLAQRLGRIIVLKGAGTVVSDGQRTWTCPRGTPALATGGTGDVLTGVIAGLIAQFVPSVDTMLMRAAAPTMPMPHDRPLDLFNAARLGVLAHAIAGELWCQRRGAASGLLASELIDELPQALTSLKA